MALKEQLVEDIKKAQKSRDTLSLSVLRMVRSSIKNKEIDIRNELDDSGVIRVIASAIKQRKESVEQFRKAGRQELADKEAKEIDILKLYMPEQADEDEVRKKAAEVISRTGASSLKDMGKIMKILMTEFQGRADGGIINPIVKEMLAP